jgi:DNA-binding transcriptional LysR family regulator
MDKLRALRMFTAIADSGSLTAAASKLGSSLPAVVRGLAALETDIGIRLFTRTTRHVALTEAGRRYLESCREVQLILQEAENDLRSEQVEPQGTLSVTAPVLFGQRYVTAGVTSFIKRYPNVEVRLLLLDRVVNLVEEGLDLGIRIGPLEDSTMFVQPVDHMRRVTVASSAYLKQNGTPKHPKDLRQHNCIRTFRPDSHSWSFADEGKRISVSVRGNFTVNQIAAAAEACVAGVGVGSFLAYQVADQVASGQLRVLLSKFEQAPVSVSIIYPEARLSPARTRAFTEHIKHHLQAERHAWQLARS